MRASDGFPVRLRFTKRGKVRWISHRDVARVFERAFRIEAAPARVHAGLLAPAEGELRSGAADRATRATPSTSTSSCASRSHRRRCSDRLTAALPEGMEVTGAGALVERAPSLQEAVTASSTAWASLEPTAPCRPGGGARCDRPGRWRPTSLAITRTRKGREIVEDVRPIIRELDVVERRRRGRVVLGVELLTQPRGARPAELVAATRRASSSRPGCSAPSNGSSATARGWSRWKPTRAARAGGARVMSKGIPDVRRTTHGDPSGLPDRRTPRADSDRR